MLWIDILLYLVLPLVLEGILWLIADSIQTHITWKPFKKQYEQAKENATSDNFVVLINRDEKAGFLFGIVCVAIIAVIGIAGSIACYFTENNQQDALYVGLGIEIIALPSLFVLMHYYSRKIFITQDVMIVKSAVIKKRIDIKNIVSVEEVKLDAHLRMTIHFNRGKINYLIDTACNYDYLKKYFIEKGLLIENDLSEVK